MEFIVPSVLSLLCIGIMIGSLVIARLKKVLSTYALIIANFIIFVITYLNNQVIFELGFRPIFLSIQYLPQIYTLFTSIFIHGGFYHIIGNMIIFFFMGIAFEQRIGMKNFLLIYFATGICGALTHSLLNLQSTTVLIGASGAIFGILGAFAYSYPRDEVVMPVPLGIVMIFRRIKVMYAAVLFALLETAVVFFDVQDNTAHFAHIGGIICGVFLAAILVGKQGEKTNQPQETEVYYDPSKIPKKKKIDFSTLRKLAISSEQREMLNRIEDENVLQVRDIWLEHFLEKATCPICGKPLNHFNRRVWCEDNHINMEY